MEEANGCFVQSLNCNVEAFKYDFEAKMLRLYLPANNHTDMTRAVNYALGIDKDVKRIYTYVRSQPDVGYKRKTDSDEWEIVTDITGIFSETLLMYKEMGCIHVATCTCGCTEHMMLDCPIKKKFLEMQSSKG